MKKKNLLTIALVLGLIAAFYFSRRGSDKVSTQKVERGNIESYVVASGNVEATGEHEVFSTANGVLEAVYVKNGDFVKLEQKLFRVRSTATDQEKAAAYSKYLLAVSNKKDSEQSKVSLEASVQQTRANLWAAQAKEKTVSTGVVEDRKNPSTGQNYTREELKQARSAVEAARKAYEAALKDFNNSGASIDSASSALASAWLDYQATQSADVTAKVEGFVSNLSKSINDKVEIKKTTPTQGEPPVDPILVVFDKGAQRVRLDITELKRPKVTLEQPAKIKLDAFRGKYFDGKVVHIDDVGKEVEGVASYKVLVEILKTAESENIKPGMSATVEIRTESKGNVLTIPQASLKVEGEKTFVEVLNNNNREKREVLIGVRGQSMVEVVEGLTEGDLVVTSK